MSTLAERTARVRTVLHAGAGPAPLPIDLLPEGSWREVRLDADPETHPDIVADIRDLSALEAGSFDAVFCSHCLEHVYEHDVPTVLAGFHRVLAGGGELLLIVPDLGAVAEEIVKGRLGEVLYLSSAGPVRAIDVVFGYAPFVMKNTLQAHRTGFTRDSLSAWLGDAGFEGQVSSQDGYQLFAEARKP